jgi:hypothetical protein
LRADWTSNPTQKPLGFFKLFMFHCNWVHTPEYRLCIARDIYLGFIQKTVRKGGRFVLGVFHALAWAWVGPSMFVRLSIAYFLGTRLPARPSVIVGILLQQWGPRSLLEQTVTHQFNSKPLLEYTVARMGTEVIVERHFWNSGNLGICWSILLQQCESR